MDDATISLIVLGAAIVLFIWNRLPVTTVALLSALSLYAFGVLNLREIYAGFGDPVIIFIAALFVVSDGVDATGLTAWVGQRMVNLVGTGFRRLLVTICLLGAVAAALVTPNGAVTALLPMAIAIAVRIGRSPSQLLMPLAFVSGSGALLALTGSPVNVIVSEQAASAGVGAFGFFSFAVVGVPLVLGTVAIAALIGRRTVPDRAAAQTPPDLSGYAAALADQYALEDGFYRLRVREGSPLVGKDPATVDLGPYPAITITAAQQQADGVLRPGDVLIAGGPPREISHLVLDKKLAVAMRPAAGPDGLVTGELGVAEVVVPPRSPMIGETVYPGQRRASDLVVLAIRRLGKERGPKPTELAEGDAILLHGAWPAIEELSLRRDVLVVDSPDMVRRQVAPLGGRAVRAGVILAAMVVVLALGVMPPSVAALLAALAMVLTRVINTQQAIRSISWETIILIGALIPLSEAIKTSGAADRIAKVLVDVVGSGNPYLLMLGLFVLTAAMGQIVNNTATVLIVAPIAVVAAQATDVSARPLLMLIAVAGAASFLTPIAAATNLIVMRPGGYRFGDYWRLGLPTMLLWLIVALAVIPQVWPF
jgi:di/tricarboxylate transporter